MNASSSSLRRVVAYHFRVLRLMAVMGIVACLGSVAAAPAIAGNTLAITSDFTTVNGTATSTHTVSGLPIAATTLFDGIYLTQPTSPPDDPVGTARHELLHGIGFSRAYNSFFAHTYTPTSGMLEGYSVFNEQTNTLGPDLLVLTTTGTHALAQNFFAQGYGPLLQDQSHYLMTPGLNGAAIPNPISPREINVLNIAFNWANTGGIKINVVFDNSFDAWTDAGKAVVNQDRDDLQNAFGPADGRNVFTWTVQTTSVSLVPEPSSTTLALIGIATVTYCRRRHRNCSSRGTT